MIAPLAAHLWESTLFALAAATATLLFRSNGAHVRYGLWFAASLKFLIPFAALAAIGRFVGARIVTAAPPEPVVAVLQRFSAPAALPAPARPPAGAIAAFDLTPLLVALWAIGFVAVVAVWTLRWLRIRGALRGATPVALDAPIPVRMTATRIEPGLVGIFRPVLLLPQGIETELTAAELRAVLAHELCHRSRRDNLTAAIHMLVQALFWFHPLLWWIGTRLIAERERACDEAVARSGAAPAIYAEGILKVCKLHVRSPLMCAAGVAGANLRLRIERIVGNTPARTLGTAKSLCMVVAALLLLAGPILSGWASAQGQDLAPETKSVSAPARAAGRALAALAPPAIAPPAATDAPAADPAPADSPAPALQAAEQTPDFSYEDLAAAPGATPLPVPAGTHMVRPGILMSGIYPFDHLSPAALARNEFGIVDLTATVEADGSVSKVVIDRSSGYPRLDETFRDAVAKTQFRAGRVEATPQQMVMPIRMAATPELIGVNAGGAWLAVRRASLTRPYPPVATLPLPPKETMMVAQP